MTKEIRDRNTGLPTGSTPEWRVWALIGVLATACVLAAVKWGGR